MAGDILGPPTVLTGLSITSTLASAQTVALPILALAGGSQITMASGTSLIVGSGATVTFLPGAMFSMGTIGTAGSLSSLAGTGFQLGIFFGASGCSLIGRSGNTIYTIGASAVSAAAP
jgi:hypothetical protein